MEGRKGKEKGLGAPHKFVRKLLAVSCIVFFVVSVFPVRSMFVFAGPPSSGDWIVTGTESFSDQVIVLNGSLIVENGGNLTFRNVTLKLNCAYNGQYSIEVRSGGAFHILESSIITSVNSVNRYLFSVRQDSTFRMGDSELHYCGWDHLGGTGLYINSDDAVVENSLISHNFYGIYVSSSGAVIRHNNITANQHGVTVGGDPQIYNNHISWNTVGIAISGGSSSIQNNTITSNPNAGVVIANATPVIRNNLITNNGDQGINSYSYSSSIIFNNTISSNSEGIVSSDHDSSTISENVITANHIGVHCDSNSSAIIQNNNITANGESGILCVDANPTIQGNNISQNTIAGISVGGGASPIIYNNTIISNMWAGINPKNGANPTIRDNVIMKNGAGIFCVLNASSTISGNTIAENLETGISCNNYSNPTIANNIITSNLGWGGGIHCSYHSAPTIKDNIITANNKGIECVEYSSPTIQGNNITANGDGIILDHSSSSIQWNTVTSNNNTGISIGEYGNATVNGNIITGNQRGIQIHSNSTSTIQANEITENTVAGVSFVKWGNGLLEGNLIAKNSEGIYLQRYCNPLINNNIISFNEGNGIRCEDESKPLVHKNDIYSNGGYGIINNDVSATVNATNNYWGGASGPVQSLLPDGVDPEEISGNILSNPWLTEPIIIAEITNPLSNETVSATVTVSTNVTARNGIYKVEFYINELKYTDFDSPYEWNWDTTRYAETSHAVSVKAYDVFGLATRVSITVFVDNTSPTVSIKEPMPGNTYYGMIRVSANATDNREVGWVYVRVDNGTGLLMAYNSTDSLWKYDLNTTTLPDGQHTITSLAKDKAGNPTNTSITIFTDNTPPTLTIQSPTSGMTVGLTLAVSVQANDLSSISRVEFYLHNVLVSIVYTVPYQWTWDTTRYPNGEYTITVKAYDSVGNVGSQDITITVNNVEVPWWQANFWAIMQVILALAGLMLGIVTILWSRERQKRRKKKTKKKEITNVYPKTNPSRQD